VINSYSVIPGRAPKLEERRGANPESRDTYDPVFLLLDSGFALSARPGMTR
jgi:hypothetical protein